MGRASKWLKGLLGFKKAEASNTNTPRRWSFTREKERRRSADEHAIAVAAASAAVAEAAVAAAQAAAAVVQLTGGFNSGAYVTRNGAGYGRPEERAAVMIQSHFRAYLSRQALRALKALVMLQALVRGQIQRKLYDQRRKMHAILCSTSNSSPLYHSVGEALQERLDYTILARNAMQDQLVMLKKKSSRSNSCNLIYNHEKSPIVRHRLASERSWEQMPSWYDERNDKILHVVDTWKPKHNHMFHFSPQVSQSYSQDDDNDFTTAENSPHYYSAASSSMGSRWGPFRTPTKNNEGPSYMAYTESSKAKVRSLSVPKQRPQYERSSSTNRYSVHGYGDSKPNKAAYASGRLDRLGMPVRGDVSGFSGELWHRY